MALSIVQAKLIAGETPVCGVSIRPYILLRRGSDATQFTSDEIPEEGTSDSRWSLRIIWYRSVLNRGGACCWVHPDRGATIQCILCLRARGNTSHSYHCGIDCFKASWHNHKTFHERQANGYADTNGHRPEIKANNTFSTGGETWIEVGKGKSYTPAEDDIGAILKVEVTPIDKNCNPVEVSSPYCLATARVRQTPVPPQRSMVPLPNVKHISAESTFTVLTYNILADLYATPEQYNYCQPHMLAWPYRKQNLIKELLSYNADILCLQEVQSNHYSDFLQPELKKHGYDSLYKKKATEIYTGQVFASDGCATFFKTSRFKMMKKYEVEFNKAALSLADGIPPERKKLALNRLLKDNVALIIVLELLSTDKNEPLENGEASTDAQGAAGGKDNRQLVCIANTHIHANPELSDIKLWQVSTLLKGLEKIHASADIPMVVAGDFNSVPGSAVHLLLLKGAVDSKHPELENDPLKILQPQSKLSHLLNLSSAYAGALDHFELSEYTEDENRLMSKQRRRVDPKTKEPKMTNAGRDFKGTLDYILYSRKNIVPLATLELPEEHEVLVGKPGLPNDMWSSDHIALMGRFTLLPKGQTAKGFAAKFASDMSQ
eukprot:jgi/Botrbrau1/4291/Bobra.0390s0031.1